MLEMMLSGAKGKSITLIPSTMTPLQGDLMAITARASGYENGTRLYATIVKESEQSTGFTPVSTSAVLSGGSAIFRFTLPINAAYNYKTFMVGVGLDVVSAGSIMTAISVTKPITIQELVDPVGQVVITNSISWKVPSRVTKLSGVIIGGGGGGYLYAAGGGGGALLYFNDYPVKPGDTFKFQFFTPSDVTDDGGGVQLFINNVQIVNLGGGETPSSDNWKATGGTIAMYNAAFDARCTKRPGESGTPYTALTDPGLGGRVGNYRRATPQAFGEPLDGTSGTLYGIGNNGYRFSGIGSGVTGGIASPAIVRLIWGPGRSYPDNAVDAAVIN